MTLLHRLASVLDWLCRRSRAEQHLDEELQAFIEMSVAEKMRDGVPPAEARRLAMLELGGLEQAKERVRTGRHGAWLDEVGRDVRYAFRTFVGNPGFTVVVVTTLALGIGANTAIFSLLDALMLRWLPVQRPQELVQVMLREPGATGPGGDAFSYPIVRALAEQHDIFTGVAGFSGYRFDVGGRDGVVHVPGALVTGGFYETLGLRPVVGRLLTREDDEPGAPLTAVVSYGYWERELARSTDAVGRTIVVNGLSVTIVGVSPLGFTGTIVGQTADITMAFAVLPHVSPSAAPLLGPGNFWLRALARPRAELSREAAVARLNAAWVQMADAVIAPHWSASRRQAMAAMEFQLEPGGTGYTYLRTMFRTPLLVLMAVVAVVLLVACANVASLMLARASARRREIAVRLAIGAGRGRIVRQLLVESTMLSLIGAACGIALAWISGRFLIALISTGPVAVVFDLTPNWHVLAFTTAVAVAAGVLFGVAPALRATAVAPAGALKESSRSSTSRSRLLPSLVSAQVALSLVLLAGAGLFVRTLQNLRDLDPGFTADGVLLAPLDARRTAAPQELLEDVTRLPDVVAASWATHTPLSGAFWSEPAVPAGQGVPEKENTLFVGAGPEFFTTMGIPLRSGRAFTERDSADGPAVAIVNEAYAREHFGDRHPVGEYLTATVRGQRRDLEVVGVATNVHASGLRAKPPSIVYVAYAQVPGDFPTTLAVRVHTPDRAASDIRQTLQAHLPGTPIEIRPLAAQVEATIVQERMMATLAGAFGVLALTLACVGLYGLLAYSVVQRTREIGIRMALGARAARVVAFVLVGGARLVLIGVVVGLPIAWMASRWIESMLFGLTPADPATIGGAVVRLLAAALLAACVPALRAARVDPLTALRHE